MIKKFTLCHKTREVKLSTVSGVASTKPSLIKFFDTLVPSVDIITTKSFQVKPNSGNREPIITEDNLGTWGNSVGLRNPGMDEAVKEIKYLRKERLNKWLNISLSADNEDDFITLVNAFSPYADSVELNFSCPQRRALEQVLEVILTLHLATPKKSMKQQKTESVFSLLS